MTQAEPLAQETARAEEPSRLKGLFLAIGKVRSRCPDILLACVPWIQVKHPLLPVQREWVEQGGWRETFTLPRRIGRFLAGFCYAGYLSARIFQVRVIWAATLRELRKNAFPVVAKSWAVDGSLAAGGNDFYLGNLRQRLRRRGVAMLTLIGNPSGQGWKIRPPQRGDEGLGLLNELALCPLWSPFAVLWSQMKLSGRLEGIAAMEGDPDVKRVAERAGADLLTRRILHNGLYERIGRDSARHWRPRAWVTLYEGNGWEQCIWRGVKRASPDCKTVGYQHTILLRHNLTLLDPEGSSFQERPDVVLCLGPRPQRMLQASHARSTLIPFGSFRSGADQTALPPRPELRTVLVVPEGYPWEARILFDCAIRAASLRPEWRFVLRCHPVLPFERIRTLLKQGPEGIANVRVSRGRTLEEDLRDSSLLLYRGSSVALYAVLNGLQPVYLEDPAHGEVDPLFELGEWRKRAASAEQLAALLDGWGKDRRQEWARWRLAASYVEEYAVPVSPEAEERFLEAVGLELGGKIP